MATLREIMTTDVYAAGADATVTEVAQAMVKGRFGSAIVLEGGWLAGIFTERDVLRAAAGGGDLSKTSVREWMTKDPQTAPPEMVADEAASVMIANGFRHLPVVEGKDVVGIVSLRDVLSSRIGR